MEKKYQIFISSTFEDLKEERRKVQDTILSMYHFPIGMEMFSAADEEQWEIIKETIDSSDYYILIIGYRYGTVIENGEDAGISYTQKEYNYAISKNIPILAFLIDEQKVAVTPNKIEQDKSKRKKLEKFKKDVSKKPIEKWENADDLAKKVSIALNKEFVKGKRNGWQRIQEYKVLLPGNITQYRTEFGIEQIPLKDLLMKAKQEIYIFGNTLSSLYNEKYIILNLLQRGIKVKLLTMNLFCESDYERNCNYLQADIERMKLSSKLAYVRIKEIRKEYSKDNFQVKLTTFPISIVIVALDIEEDGIIIATHLLPTGEPTRNCLTNKICTDSIFYERYKTYIKRFWNESVEEFNENY